MKYTITQSVIALDREVLNRITELLLPYSGPFGKFVVVKTVRDMGYEVDTFPYDKLKELIITCIQRSVFDPAKREEAKKNILKEFDLY